MPNYDPNFFSRAFAPPSPDFNPEDYFKAQAGEDFRDVQRNVGQRAASGLGYGTVNSMVANRLGQSINQMQARHLLDQVAAGNKTPSSNYADAFSALGDKWASGTMGTADPYKALAQMSANAKLAAASGDQSASAYLDLLGSAEVQNALQYAANTKYGGPVARGFQSQMNDLSYNANRMGAGQNIGDLYTSQFGLAGLPQANVAFAGGTTTPPATTTPATTTPTTGTPQTDPASLSNEPTYSGPAFVPANTFAPNNGMETGWMGNYSPVDGTVDNAFRSYIGREATPQERAWWKQRYQGMGGDAGALDQVVSQIAGSEPAQRFQSTGQAAPAVNSPNDAAAFYDWLFAGRPEPNGGRDAWIANYLRVLGMG